MRLKDITLEELVEIIRNVVRDELEKLVRKDIIEKIKVLINTLKK